MSNGHARASFPPIPQPRGDIASLLLTTRALVQIVEILLAQRGDGSNAAVLRKDMQ